MTRNKPLASKQLENVFSVIRTMLAVLIALAIAFLLISSVSKVPFKDFTTLLIGPLQNTSRMVTVLSKFIPLLFTGTAICMIYSCGQINIAAEGAFFLGCVAATMVAVQDNLPAPLYIPLCLIAATLTGAIVMVIPGIMHVRYQAVTIVTALMMNYISLYLGLYIILNPLRDPMAGFEASFLFSESARLPFLFGSDRIHFGLIIGILAVLLGTFILYRTSLGYAIRTVGANPRFATASGISVGKTIIITSLIAGGLSGLGGAAEILGNYQRFNYTGFTNHGWDGIMLAVLCRNNPKYMPLAALFLAYLKTSADALNFTSMIPPEIIRVIQAIVIVFIAAERFLSGWEHRAIVSNSKKALELEEV